MISTVVFDFDGTLVDSNAVKRQGFFDVVASHAGGVRRMESVLARAKGDRRAVFSEYVADAARSGMTFEDDIEALVGRYSRHVDAGVAAAPEMPGASDLLARLHERGTRLFLSSATPVANLHAIVEKRGWVAYFDQIFGHPADKRESLQAIRATSGSSADSMAVVGDGADDRDSAASIGCAFFPVGEARGATAPEHVFTLPELMSVLLDHAHAAT